MPKDKVPATCASCAVSNSALAAFDCLPHAGCGAGAGAAVLIEQDMQMRFISFLLLLVTGLAVATDVDELKIETTYAPPECVLKTQSGDGLKVHYVSPQLDGRR